MDIEIFKFLNALLSRCAFLLLVAGISLVSGCKKMGKVIGNTAGSLPLEAQYAPVYALNVLDYNRDGKVDVLLAGNQNQARLRFGKADANYRVLLPGNG